MSGIFITRTPALPAVLRTAGIVSVALALVLAAVWLLMGFEQSWPMGQGAVKPPSTAVADLALSELRDLAALPAVALKLRTKLAATPDDANGWALLARTYVKLGQYQPALESFSVAVKLAPGDADLHVEYADTLATWRGSKFDAESRALVQKALQLVPNHVGALSLAGLDSYDRKDYGAAITYWKRLVASAPPDHLALPQIRSGIAAAKQQL